MCLISLKYILHALYTPLTLKKIRELNTPSNVVPAN